MRKLKVFNQVSLDGYFVDGNGGMQWAHNPQQDEEWDAFVAGNANAGGVMVFGRITYDLMKNYWPTELAAQQNPVVARRMNEMTKIVFSRTVDHASWQNTTFFKSDPAGEIRRMKKESGPDMAILGSGSIISQLTQERLIDEYQLVVIPIVLGAGRTMFDGMSSILHLKCVNTRAFRNGNVLLCYVPVM